MASLTNIKSIRTGDGEAILREEIEVETTGKKGIMMVLHRNDEIRGPPTIEDVKSNADRLVRRMLSEIYGRIKDMKMSDGKAIPEVIGLAVTNRKTRRLKLPQSKRWIKKEYMGVLCGKCERCKMYHHAVADIVEIKAVSTQGLDEYFQREIEIAETTVRVQNGNVLSAAERINRSFIFYTCGIITEAFSQVGIERIDEVYEEWRDALLSTNPLAYHFYESPTGEIRGEGDGKKGKGKPKPTPEVHTVPESEEGFDDKPITEVSPVAIESPQEAAEEEKESEVHKKQEKLTVFKRFLTIEEAKERAKQMTNLDAKRRTISWLNNLKSQGVVRISEDDLKIAKKRFEGRARRAKHRRSGQDKRKKRVHETCEDFREECGRVAAKIVGTEAEKLRAGQVSQKQIEKIAEIFFHIGEYIKGGDNKKAPIPHYLSDNTCAEMKRNVERGRSGPKFKTDDGRYVHKFGVKMRKKNNKGARGIVLVKVSGTEAEVEFKYFLNHNLYTEDLADNMSFSPQVRIRFDEETGNLSIEEIN